MAEKKARLRKAAIYELLSTEKTYVDLMSKLVEHFVQKLRGHSSMLSSEDHKILFPSDIHAILGLNRTFLTDLTAIIESDNFNNHNTKIGDIIFSFCPHFKMYQNYLNNYSAAATRLAKLRSKSSSSFSVYCDKQREEPYFNHLGLESLIILPIQRMPRYKMLLEEIIKRTNSDHPDLTQLQNALSKITQVNNVINSRMKEFDSRIEVQNIENRFNGKITNLVTPARRFIKQGQLCKIETKDDQDFLFILFSDCILYASQPMIGDKLTFGNLLHFNSKFKVAQTSKTVNVHNIENLFQIHSTNESFMVYASSNKDMHVWIESITKTCKEYMSLATTVKNQELNLKSIFAATLQIPNDFASVCMINGCNTKFSFVNRRHHCKYCGFVVCSKCSANQLQSRPTAINSSTEMVRVCDVCYKTNAGNTSLKNVTTPTLTSKKSSSKALELLGYTDEDSKNDALGAINEDASVVSKNTLESLNKKNDLLKMYEKRAKIVESKERKSVLKLYQGRNVPPPPSKESKHSKNESLVVLDFVKLDIEPKLNALESENDSLKEENESLKEKINKLERDIVGHNSEIDKVKKHSSELESDKARLQSLVDKLHSTTDESKKAEEISNSKIKTLEAHNTNLMNELRERESEIKVLLNKESVLLQYQTKNAKLEVQISEQYAKIHELEVLLLNANATTDHSKDLHILDRLQELSEEKTEETISDIVVKAQSAPSSTLIASTTSPIVTMKEDILIRNSEVTVANADEKVDTPNTPMTPCTKAMQSLMDNSDVQRFLNGNGEKIESKRVCQTCNKEIVGRALRTKGGLHHRSCHVCNECKVSLAGKRYGITQSKNGKKVKLCEQCTNKANEKRREQFHLNKSAKVRKKRSASSLMDQMSKFRQSGNRVPKPWETTLKPAKERIKKAKSVTKTSVVGYSHSLKKRNAKSISLMAQKKCTKCKSAIFGKNKVEGPNQTVFHPNCFRCQDCDNELQPKNWRSYPLQNKKGKNTHTLTLCPVCVKKRDEILFTQHKGKLKLNI